MIDRLRTLWAQHRTPASRLARRITLAATIVFLFVVCEWRPWNLFARGGFSTDFYDAQADAFWHLRLHVPANIAGPEGFLIDGKTYLYYGPVLAIVRMPFALFGHWADGRLSRASMVLAFFLACTLARHLATRVGAMLGGGSPRRTAVLVAAVAVSPALSLAGWNSVYDETEMWAFALFLATALALLSLWVQPTRRALLASIVLATTTILTRSSVGLGALAAVGMVGLLLWHRDRRLAVGAAGGAIAGVLANVVVNVAKFGTLFDLPADRQLLSLQNPARAAWFAGNGGSFFGLRFLPTTIVQYLRPDTVRLERLVPFVRFGPLAHEFGSYRLETNTPSTSLTASATLLFVLAVAGAWIVIRRRSWPLLVLLVGGLVAAAPSFLIGFVANRYLTDMLPALVVPAAVAVTLLRVPAGGLGRAGRWGVVALAVWGVWVNVSLAVWTQSLKQPGFTDLRYRIDDAIFGGAPPSVVALVPDQQAPRDGVVGIDGDCDGLYIAEQRVWVALELADGVRRLHGTIDTTNGPVSIVAPGGDIEIVFDHGAALATYTPDAGDPVSGAQFAVGAAGSFEITSDPVMGHLEVTVNSHQVLFAFAAPSLADAEVSDNAHLVQEADGNTPICHRLQARQ